ncbi:MAG: site-specific DNA-methyltransferase [Pseudanabaena sp. M152S2SP2A07QC]|nr:site-specific DNA-methyltransferase [Pseudanabaena sp. M109S1SP2A07QC]MCA6546635.1 site-specific DNA-methyltransferase [Pseudanabaena sp. M152S2SP2A07QC]
MAPNSIINGDCLEVMKDIDDRSIDCIICDLPYGITACKWDVVIPFDLLWEQYKRIIKPNGAIALFGSQPFTSALVMSNPKWFKYEWIWDKEVGSNFGCAKWMPMKIHENISIFCESACNYYPIKHSRSVRKNHGGKQYTSSNFQSNFIVGIAGGGLKHPYSIIKRNSQLGETNNTNRIHPTQKPVALIEYLIKTYTQEGELILDNTAGSGTLAIAAINTNRQYICIEKDPHYFEVMRNRIANHDPNAPVKAKKAPRAPKGQLTIFDGGLAV